MDTKTCKKCGWVLAIQDPTVFCPICKTRFEVGICRICGKVAPYYDGHRRVCRDCFLHVTKKPDDDARLAKRRQDVYAEWKAKIAKVPKTYPTLTEDQWMQACKYFSGCACCGDASIDARGYFVPFKEGGRYCDWNIVPMCEKCASTTYPTGNAFINSRRPKGLLNIINYLEDKLDAASKS